MIFCKDIDRARPGSSNATSFLNNIATMFFKSITSRTIGDINDKTTTITINNDVNNTNNDDNLYCIPIETAKSLKKRKRKVVKRKDNKKKKIL